MAAAVATAGLSTGGCSEPGNSPWHGSVVSAQLQSDQGERGVCTCGQPPPIPTRALDRDGAQDGLRATDWALGPLPPPLSAAPS